MDTILDVIVANLPEILTLLLTITIVWKFSSKALKVMQELKELLAVIISAMADKRLTADELAAIVKESKDVAEALITMLKGKEEEEKKNGNSD